MTQRERDEAAYVLNPKLVNRPRYVFADGAEYARKEVVGLMREIFWLADQADSPAEKAMRACEAIRELMNEMEQDE